METTQQALDQAWNQGYYTGVMFLATAFLAIYLLLSWSK